MGREKRWEIKRVRERFQQKRGKCDIVFTVKTKHV